MRIARSLLELLLLSSALVLLGTCVPNVGPEDDDDDHAQPLVWTAIRGGSFEMGCDPNDTKCNADEKPRHEVTLSAFQMTKSAVTQQQYQSVIGSNPSHFSECGGDCPVETVTWAEAKAFCTAVGGRLPTEAEWEYAARAGTTTFYYCGDDATCLDNVAWYYITSGGTPHPVCQKPTNAWGLCDMLGNVDQWVADWYDATYYGVSPSNNPPGPASGTYRLSRGGGWDGLPRELRSSSRHLETPLAAAADLGFRCVRD
jgi:formylglycine-generating enzyme required for sulfatase activity